MPTTRIPTYFPIYLRLAVFLLALAAAFAVLYHSAIAHMVSKWTTPDGSHGILILGVSLYLVWIKRHELLELRPDPALLPGALLLAAGCFMLFAGVISSTILVQMISMVPVLLGAILLFGGFSFFRIFLLPVGYLIFLTGLVEQLLGGFAIYFQQFAAWFAGGFFSLIGIPVFHDYTIIQLPHITLEVVRACAGIGHIVALFALAVPIAFLTQSTWLRKSIIVFSAFIIGLLANGLRIVLIGLFTMFFPGAGTHGPYATLQVSVIFFFGLVLLLVLTSLLGRKGNNPANTQDSSAGDDAGNAPDENGRGLAGFEDSGINPENFPARKQYCSYIIGALILAVTLGLVHFYTPRAVALERPLSTFPMQVAGFSGKDIENVHDSLRPFPADAELLRRYENAKNQAAEIYIGYFRDQDSKKEVIDYRRDWMHAEASKVSVQHNGKDFVINKIRLRSRSEAADVYFWYSMNGKIILNQYVGKLMTFLSSVFTRSNNGAVIVISTNTRQEEIMPLIAGLVEAAQKHLDQ